MKPNHFTSHSNIELKPGQKSTFQFDILASPWNLSTQAVLYVYTEYRYHFHEKIMVLCWGYIGATKFNFKMELFEYWQIWKKDLAI
jgi:hypothetical protein